MCCISQWLRRHLAEVPGGKAIRIEFVVGENMRENE